MERLTTRGAAAPLFPQEVAWSFKLRSEIIQTRIGDYSNSDCDHSNLNRRSFKPDLNNVFHIRGWCEICFLRKLHDHWSFKLGWDKSCLISFQIVFRFPQLHICGWYTLYFLKKMVIQTRKGQNISFLYIPDLKIAENSGQKTKKYDIICLQVSQGGSHFREIFKN